MQSFTREEVAGGLSVRVSNTDLNLVSYWDMGKFEARLDQMREVYQARGSACSLEEHSTTSPPLGDDPFNSPSDSWSPSPLRWVWSVFCRCDSHTCGTISLQVSSKFSFVTLHPLNDDAHVRNATTAL